MKESIDFQDRFQEINKDVVLQYPMHLENFPSGSSRLHSPQKYSNPEGLPEPAHFGTEAYEELLWEAVEACKQVERGIYPTKVLEKWHPDPDYDASEMPIPLQMQGLSVDNPMDCAYAVSMDNNIDVTLTWRNYLNGDRELNADGFEVRRDGGACDLIGNDDELPLTGHTEFLARVPFMNKVISDASYENLQRAFNAKWFFGRIRPAIAAEKLTNIPAKLWRIYPHPPHAAYPAGHGAADAMEAVRPYYNTNKEDIRQGFNTGYTFSMWRLFSLMHTADENIAGQVLAGKMIVDNSTATGFNFAPNWDYTKL